MLRKMLMVLNVLIFISALSLRAENTATESMMKGNEFAKEKRYGEAITQYEAVLKAEPENTRVLLLLGLAYANLNKPNEAIQYTKRASETEPSYAAFYNLGLLYAVNNQSAKALEAFDRALEFNPESYMAEYQKGNVYTLEKNYEEAAQAYRRSIKLNPDFEKAYIGVVGSEYRKGDKTEAQAYIEELKKAQKTTLAKELEDWINKQFQV